MTQFLRDEASDSEEDVTSLMLVVSHRSQDWDILYEKEEKEKKRDVINHSTLKVKEKMTQVSKQG